MYTHPGKGGGGGSGAFPLLAYMYVWGSMGTTGATEQGMVFKV